MEPFLRERGIVQHVIDKMIADKIDCDILTKMTDEQLKHFIPAYGDRIAVMAFASTKALMTQKSTDSEPGSLFHTISMRGTKRAFGNMNAAKATRRLEMGWLHQYAVGQTHKQVRLRSGGGTRNLKVLKTCSVQDILTNAVETFFPDGNSKLGSLSDMVAEIRDFKGDILDYNKTVETVYKEVKMRMLRVYLYTSYKNAETTETSRSTSSEDELPSFTDSTICPAAPYSHAQFPAPISSPDPEVTFHPRHRTTQAPMSSSHSVATTCQNVIPEIEILDSDDEAIQAIEAAHVEPCSTRVDSDTQELAEILKTFQDRFIQNVHTNCVISRAKPLDSAIRTLERKTVNLQNKLFVKFSGEIGEDHGGPRREFFRLAIAELQKSKFFEGPEGSKIFSHDLQLVEKGHYKIVGRLLAMSLAQDGPGFHCMNRQLYSLMTGQAAEATPAAEIMASDILECLGMLEEMTTIERRDQFLSKYGDWLIDRGINAYRMTVDGKRAMAEMITKYHVFYRTSSEITQFKVGMNDVGDMWELITKNADTFQLLFCHLSKPLSKREMDNIIRYDYSDLGSNSRMFEDETVYAWELFLEGIEDQTVPASMGELLAFMSGASTIPPCGFHKPIDIHFYTQEDGMTRLPSVSTCSLEMWLPRGQGPETLSALLMRCLQESHGFLKI